MRTFFTDLHIFAPNELYDFKEPITQPPNVYFLGDIFDLMNCKKDEVGKVKDRILNLKRIMGDQYLFDNHDAIYRKVSEPLKVPDSDIVILGGSQIFWDEDRIHNYTQKEFGAGFFKRQIWVRALMIASNFVSDKISDKAMSRAVDIALKNGATKVVCGHKHPKKLLTRTQEGITLYVLPRGLTMLEI